MYGALWRSLPGPWWLRVIILLAGLAAVVAGLFYYVYPELSLLIPQEATVGN